MSQAPSRLAPGREKMGPEGEEERWEGGASDSTALHGCLGIFDVGSALQKELEGLSLRGIEERWQAPGCVKVLDYQGRAPA